MNLLNIKKVEVRKFALEPVPNRPGAWNEHYRLVRSPAKVYVGVENESILENLAYRHARPYEVWRPYVEKALKAEGIEFEKVSWNRKAGCSCGCSPGFVIKGPGGRNVRGLAVHILLEANAPKLAEGAAPRIPVEML